MKNVSKERVKVIATVGLNFEAMGLISTTLHIANVAHIYHELSENKLQLLVLKEDAKRALTALNSLLTHIDFNHVSKAHRFLYTDN